ncbi:HAD family hydrolase [Streptomyces sp. NPDC056352]|uniref:HAD family hydrolase n=1 Tax=Streptomyces sp. NPDC056352 TaxID=3345791 RepID=UPI0035E009D6
MRRSPSPSPTDRCWWTPAAPHRIFVDTTSLLTGTAEQTSPPHTAESDRLQAVVFRHGRHPRGHRVGLVGRRRVGRPRPRIRPRGGADTPDVLGRSVEHTPGHLHRTTGGRVPAAHLAGELLREFADRVATQVVPRSGALELVDALREAGIPAALVSASPRAVDTVLTTIGRRRFDITITVEDTPRTKPVPDPYLAAAAALGVPPRACVAVEGSAVGAASAEAAGCPILVVSSLIPVPAGPGRHIISGLDYADLALLQDLAAGADRPPPRTAWDITA